MKFEGQGGYPENLSVVTERLKTVLQEEEKLLTAVLEYLELKVGTITTANIIEKCSNIITPDEIAMLRSTVLATRHHSASFVDDVLGNLKHGPADLIVSVTKTAENNREEAKQLLEKLNH